VKVEGKNRGIKWAREVYETRMTGRNGRWEEKKDNDVNDEEKDLLWDDLRSFIKKMNNVKAPVALGSVSA
jgi:hypothetical protein